jgi:hypothetical protein
VQDIAEYVSDYIDREASPVKATQVLITQSDILNPSGFSKTLISATPGKITIPKSIALYRKPGGTSYNLSTGTVGLFSVANSLSSPVVGVGSLNIAFQSSNEGTTYPSVNSGTTLSQMIRPGNSIHIASNSPSISSVITEGTGDIVAYLTYVEIIV